MAVTCPAIDPTKPLGPAPIPSIDFTLYDWGGNPATYAVPWPTFKAKAFTVPGGNLYYNVTIPYDPQKPRSFAGNVIVNMMALSKKHFENYFGRGHGQYADMKMSDVLATYHGKLVTSYGAVTTSVQPDPNEKAKDYVTRGGYLLWVDPQTGVFTGKQAIMNIGVPPWMSTARVREFNLFARYIPDTGNIILETRLQYDGDFTQWVNEAARAFEEAMKKACGLITSDKLAAAAAYAATYPQAAPEIASWSLAAQLCNMAFPACTPATGPKILQLGPINVKPKYPTGTIAYYDGAVYRIAIPQGLAGFAATYTEIAREPTRPTGVAAVSYWTWQRVTKPIWSRTSFFLGTGTAAAVGAGILFAVIHRRH